MILCTCKCLNIQLRVEGETSRAERIADGEQRDVFFRQEVMWCESSALVQEVRQPALASVRRAGAWSVHTCLACGTHTHALHTVPPSPALDALLNKATQTTEEAIERLKSSPNFSPVFKVLVPEISSEEFKENVDGNKSMVALVPPAVPSLYKQLSSSLQSRLESIEESVRMYRDQKYAEYEDYRERAHKDHKILASMVNKARAAEEARRRRAGDAAQLSPPAPEQQRRRLSSFKDAKKLKHNVVKNTRNMGSEEDSLDSEDIFDLEGDVPSHNGNNSDADNYDSEADSGSNDEGIHARGPGPGRAPTAVSIARSLPMNMPKFTSNVRLSRHQPEDEEEPLDIAASIKALARSVHADVFGDLPRPRFSTQI